MKSETSATQESDRLIKRYNRLLIILIFLCILYPIITVTILNKTKDNLIILDVQENTNSLYFRTNFLVPSEFATSTNLLFHTNGMYPTLFEKKKSYKIGDLVVIDYFLIQGIVAEKNDNHYVILYKDKNRQLQKISLGIDFLLGPASNVTFFPFSFQ